MFLEYDRKTVPNDWASRPNWKLALTCSVKLTVKEKKKAHQRFYCLRKLKGADMSTAILKSFYKCVVESILTSCITLWHCSCTVAEKQALQQVVNSAQWIIGCRLPSLSTIYITRCMDRAASIMKDSTHPAHGLFTLLPSGRRLRSIQARTTRLRNTFYQDDLRLLNC